MAKREEKLYTLTEISKRAKISMPTLQRYKKLYAERIPSVGEGRRQRYPLEAVKVLRELKKENLAKRGRPRKTGSSAAKPATKAGRSSRKTKKKAARKKAVRRGSTRGRRAASSGLLTLSEIGRRTAISYPTLLRYVKLHAKRIPHVGSGRRRRFPEEAVAVFQQLRGESKRGPKKGGTRRSKASSAPANGGLKRRLRELEKAHKRMAKQLDSILEQLKKPLEVTIKR